MMLAKKKSVTAELLALRADASAEVVPGQWHASFAKTKAYAEKNNLPFVAVWTNGDLCGYCITLEKCFLDPSFIDFMKKSGYVYWLGCGPVDSGSDVTKGKAWVRDNGRLTTYPYMRATWGKNDKAMSGNNWDDHKAGADGAARVIKRLELLFKDFMPMPVQVEPPAATTTAEQPAPAEEVKKEEAAQPAAAEVTSPDTGAEAIPAADAPEKKFKVHFNPEWTKAQIKEFQKKIKANGGHCPCQEPSDDTKCMCKDFRVDKKNVCGLCICKLYERYEVK